MKTNLLKSGFLILALLVLFSCKKNAGSKYYVKLKIDGTWVTWKNVLGELGPDLADDTKTDFGITGNDKDYSDIFDISIQVDGPNLGTGIYESDDPDIFLTVLYYVDSNTPNFNAYHNDDATGMPPSKYTVTITSITDEMVKGYFTGNYLSDFDENTVAITEGEFAAPRIR